MITLLGKRELVALSFFVCGLSVVWHGLFVLCMLFGVIGRVCSVNGYSWTYSILF